ncbi:MAG: hypothetical protein ACQGVC_17665 [Myxococcota bacterium]
MTDEPRRFEPWPWILAGLLVFMIGTSLAFYHVAATHPDPVIDDAAHPGVSG